MRKRPEAVAWLVIWISFGVFVVSCAALVGGATWYRGAASQPREATVTAIQGAVFATQLGRTVAVPAGGQVDLQLYEGDTVVTEEGGRALIRFFENSTLTLWPGSAVTLSSMRRSRFAPQWDTLEVTQDRGKSRVGVAPSVDSQSSFVLRWLRSLVTLRDGSYAVEVEPDGASVEIAVRDGKARVESAGNAAELTAGQRVVVPRGKPPGPVAAAAKELVRNGRFADGLDGWAPGNVNVAAGSPAGQVRIVEDGEQHSVLFERTGSGGTPQETRIVQTIDRDVSDFLSLVLSLRIKIAHQSLAGGGFMGSEYPVMVLVKYRGVDGEDGEWRRGFYAGSADGNLTTNGEKIGGNQWVQISKNLMGPDVFPRPAHVVWIKVSASGHDYESLVSQISLAGE